jgi:hypothetical protein
MILFLKNIVKATCSVFQLFGNLRRPAATDRLPNKHISDKPDKKRARGRPAAEFAESEWEAKTTEQGHDRQTWTCTQRSSSECQNVDAQNKMWKIGYKQKNMKKSLSVIGKGILRHLPVAHWPTTKKSFWKRSSWKQQHIQAHRKIETSGVCTLKMNHSGLNLTTYKLFMHRISQNTRQSRTNSISASKDLRTHGANVGCKSWSALQHSSKLPDITSIGSKVAL